MHSSLSRESQPDPERLLSVPPPSVTGSRRLDRPFVVLLEFQVARDRPRLWTHRSWWGWEEAARLASGHLSPSASTRGLAGHSTVGQSSGGHPDHLDIINPLLSAGQTPTSSPTDRGLLCPFDRHRLGSLGTRPLPSAPSGISTSQPESRPVAVSTPRRVAANETAPHRPPCV